MVPSRKIIAILILALIIAAGFGAGVYVSLNKDRLSWPSLPAGTTSVVNDDNDAPNHTTYEISPTSRGAAIKTFPIDLRPVDGTAIVPLPADDAKDIKTGQAVLLYDEGGLMIEILGEVTAISPASDGAQVNVTILIKGDEKIPASMAARGQIIIERKSDAQRLPLSAIIRNDKDEPYLWEVFTNADGTHTAYYKRANIVMNTFAFVVVAQKASTSNVFILNPDKNLRDGQKINVRKILFSGPAEMDDTRIARLMEERKPRTMNDPYTGPPLPADCGSAGGASRPPGAALATPTCPIAQDFLNTIRKSTQQTP